MAFVPEDGTGLPDANSYATVEEADDYFSDRGVVAWSGTDAQKQGWLIQATDYIEGRFGTLFIGCKKTDEQALSWPREQTSFADDVVPTNLKKACFEYALRAKTAPLAPDMKLNEAGVAVVTTRRKVGPIETEYAQVQSGYGSQATLFRPYPAADMYLRGLLQSANRVIR